MGEELAVPGSESGLRRGCELVFTSVKFRLGIFREIWSDTPRVTLKSAPLCGRAQITCKRVFHFFTPCGTDETEYDYLSRFSLHKTEWRIL